MKCIYCGKDINENDKYCQFCGAPIRKETEETGETKTETNTGRVGQAVEKKPVNAKKIILTVVGVIVAIHLLGWALIFAIFAAFGVYPSNFNEKLGELDKVIEEFNDSMNEEYNYDEFENDDYDINFDFGEDGFNINFKDNNKDKNKDTTDKSNESSFKAGTVNVDKNSYKSNMADISFTLSEDFITYSDKEIDNLYSKTNISESMRNKNAIVYDFYAKNALGTKVVYVDFVNKDYYSEYKNLDGYIKHVKATYDDYENSGYKVEFAEDSKFYPSGKDSSNISFTQIATRITDSRGNESYDYSLVSEIEDYYVIVTIVGPELSDISAVLNSMSGK